ncbi:hypothetical protein [Chryseobacterium ginsenosidimutans]|uniref:hypothetical protein n=1 Tax=Chryseobacterium ginsenosidimutans TaxID=687846 RepID=UPI0027BAFEB3|nr:hypothetical protein [Chryseobacterium ginsenosidimutans]
MIKIKTHYADSNTSNNLNTTSYATGTNVKLELTPESFFFLEKDKPYSQTATNKFGIVGTEAASTFRTTSRITTYTREIFAICPGQVLYSQ